MSGHTPGPWIWGEHYQGLFGAGPNNEVLKHAGYEGMWLPDYEPSGKANARLIAAAPDGLDAAITAYKALLGINNVVWRARNADAYCALRDFIAKATGQTSQEVQEHYEAIVATGEKA